VAHEVGCQQLADSNLSFGEGEEAEELLQYFTELTK
jgi:hypothetical protein